MPTRIDKETVLDAAMRVFVADPAATTADVARAAGIGRATLHRIFPSRRDLVEALAVRALTATAVLLDDRRLDEDPVPEVMALIVDRLTPLADQYAFLISQADLDKAAQSPTSELAVTMAAFEARLVAFFRRGQAEGVIRPDVPAMWLVALLGHTLIAAAEAVRAGAIGRLEAPRLVLTSFLDGAACPPR